MVEYTIETNEACTSYVVTVIGAYSSDNYLNNLDGGGAITFDIDIEAGNTIFTFDSELESVLVLTLNDSEETIYLLLNNRHLKYGNRLNKCDVDSILSSNLKTRHSETMNALNRVIIANHRTEKYTKSLEGLELVDINNTDNLC